MRIYLLCFLSFTETKFQNVSPKFQFGRNISTWSQIKMGSEMKLKTMSQMLAIKNKTLQWSICVDCGVTRKDTIWDGSNKKRFNECWLRWFCICMRLKTALAHRSATTIMKYERGKTNSNWIVTSMSDSEFYPK